MNKSRVFFFITILIFSLSFFIAGCSKQEEQQAEEKGRIEKMTDEAAEKAVSKIRTPKDKARSTRDLGDERLDAIDKALQKQ